MYVQVIGAKAEPGFSPSHFKSAQGRSIQSCGTHTTGKIRTNPTYKKDLNRSLTNMLHMKQNSYIVRELLKASNHVRGLARVLGTNSMTVSRKVKELEQSNVVDHRQEGKNKVYFIKKTL